MIPHRDPRPDQPTLRLFAPGEEPQADPLAAPVEQAPSSSGLLHPRLTLGEFFDRWFLPIILVGEVNASAATIGLYRKALDWWEQLSGLPDNPELGRDPALMSIDEFRLAAFVARLRKATYKRGLAGVERPLSKSSQKKQITMLRAILYRVGPQTDPKRPSKKLLEESLHLPSIAVGRRRVKPPFDIADARAIVAAAATATWPNNARGRKLRAEPKLSAPRFWRAFLLFSYYTGLRTGTSLALTWNMLAKRTGGVWIEVPEECVPKTHKAHEQFLHPLCLAALEAARVPGDDRLLPSPVRYDVLAKFHARLQEVLPPDRRQSPQAWRRTHGTELAKVGARAGMEAARISLDHADEATTRNFYVNIQPDLIRRLPPLCDAADLDTSRQLKLF